MKSKSRCQLVIFLMFTLCFVLFAGVENKIKGKKEQIVWDSKEKITAEAQVSSIESNKEVGLRINNEKDKVVKEEMKIQKVEDKTAANNQNHKILNNTAANNQNHKVLAKTGMTELEKKKMLLMGKKASHVKKEIPIKSSTMMIHKQIMTKSYTYNAAPSMLIMPKPFLKIDIPPKKLFGMGITVNNFNATAIQKPPKLIEFLPVNIVRQLTPAGKAALDAQNSGE